MLEKVVHGYNIVRDSFQMIIKEHEQGFSSEDLKELWTRDSEFNQIVYSGISPEFFGAFLYAFTHPINSWKIVAYCSRD